MFHHRKVGSYSRYASFDLKIANEIKEKVEAKVTKALFETLYPSS